MKRDEEIAEILADWRDRNDDGEGLDPEAIVAEHPSMAEDLREHFAAMQILDLAVLEACEQAATAEPAPDRTHVGPYGILRVIGTGGMGRVYLAEQTEPIRRQVALKVLSGPVRDPKLLARFDVERDALALMDHPYIASVYDAGVAEDGTPYVAMAYVDGEPITGFCRSEGLSLEARLELFARACEAVQHAHQKGIIHRDLKPANVLVTVVDGQPVPRVIDFGLAKSHGMDLDLATQLTMHDQVLGTPAYMSPEQAGRSGGVDVRTDVYALGVLLYELLTGDVPWGRDTTTQVNIAHLLRRILEEEPPTPSSRITADRSAEETTRSVSSIHNRDVRGDLDWIVMKAIEKEPERRYASAQALGDDVRRHLRNEPVLAGPPSAGYRLGKFISRHRAGVAAAAVALVALCAALGVSLYNVDAASRARQESDAARSEAEELLVFMMDEVAAGLEQLNRLDLIEEIDQRALAYYRGQRNGDTDVDALRRRAHALQRIGRTAMQRGDVDRTREIAADVLRLTGDRPELALPRSDALFLLAVAAQAKGDLAHAEERLRERLAGLETLDPEDARPALSKRRFEAHRALGQVLESRGRREDARHQYERALAVTRHRLESTPGEEAWEGRRASASLALGHLLVGLQAWKPAREALDRAASTLEELVARNPAATMWRQELAGTHASLGRLLSQRGQSHDALKHLRRAMEIHDQVAAEDPSNLGSQRSRAIVRQSIASPLREVGELDTALARLDEAVEITERLLQQDPDNAASQGDLYDILCGRTILHGVRRDDERAYDDARRAADLVEGMVERDPGNLFLQGQLAGAKQSLVFPLLARGEADEAVAAGRASVDAARRVSDARGDALANARLAITLAQLAQALAGSDRSDEALESYAAMEQLAEGLVGQLAENMPVQADLAQCRRQYGALLLNLRRPTDALARLRPAAEVFERLAQPARANPVWARLLADTRTHIALAEAGAGERDPKTPSEHAFRAEVLQESSHPRAALDHYRKALLDPDLRRDAGRGLLYGAACMAALVSAEHEGETRQTLQTAALEYLEESLSLKGAAVTAAARIENARVEDPLLESIRPLPAFRALFDRLQD